MSVNAKLPGATACPHCGSPLLANAPCCPACARRARAFQNCEQCREPYDEHASICPFCRSKSKAPGISETARQLEMQVRATRLGALFANGLTALLFPPIIAIHNGKVTVRSWSALGLRTHLREIQLNRIASVNYTKGIFWGTLLVETFGGAMEDMKEGGLRQDDALRMAERLKECIPD